MTPQAANALVAARKKAVAKLRAEKAGVVMSFDERSKRIDEIGSRHYHGKKFVIRREDGMITVRLIHKR